jgi:hypothetical protein
LIQSQPELTSSISLQSHINGWRKQQENTSAESSGLSFSHYKAVIQEADIAKFDAIMHDIPSFFGFAPSLWKHMTDFEILKNRAILMLQKCELFCF